MAGGSGRAAWRSSCGLGYQDAVLKAFEPQVTQALDEFAGVLAELRARLPVTAGPIGVVGASVGALPAQLVMASCAAQVTAAALVSPVIQLAEVVAANERRFGVSYPWSDASKAVAARFDFASRADELAARDPQPAILLVTGAEDDPAFLRRAQRQQAELRQRYSDPERVRLTSIPRMGACLRRGTRQRTRAANRRREACGRGRHRLVPPASQVTGPASSLRPLQDLCRSRHGLIDADWARLEPLLPRHQHLYPHLAPWLMA
jgi:dienelactone hydrolase